MESMIKTAIKIVVIIAVLAAAVITIRDYFTHGEKQKLFKNAAVYEEELVAFSKVIIEMQQLGEKYEILKNRTQRAESREALLKEVEEFLNKSGKIESKFTDLLKDYNSIVKQYNNLPEQTFWYKHSLPRELKIKTRQDFL
jgi:hypothetical protein